MTDLEIQRAFEAMERGVAAQTGKSVKQVRQIVRGNAGGGKVGLTFEDAAYIRAAVAAGQNSQAEMARMYSVNGSTISRIVNGLLWAVR